MIVLGGAHNQYSVSVLYLVLDTITLVGPKLCYYCGLYITTPFFGHLVQFLPQNNVIYTIT